MVLSFDNLSFLRILRLFLRSASYRIAGQHQHRCQTGKEHYRGFPHSIEATIVDDDARYNIGRACILRTTGDIGRSNMLVRRSVRVTNFRQLGYNGAEHARHNRQDNSN